VLLRGEGCGATTQDMEPGAFDEALAPLLPLVGADIFGAVAEAKEVAAFAGGLKEAKKQRGYEAYRLLAQGVTFRTHAAFLLSLVGALVCNSLES
jgi:hypothetical protein